MIHVKRAGAHWEARSLMDAAIVGVYGSGSGFDGQLDTLKRDPFLAQTGIAFFSGKINARKRKLSCRLAKRNRRPLSVCDYAVAASNH